MGIIYSALTQQNRTLTYDSETNNSTNNDKSKHIIIKIQKPFIKEKSPFYIKDTTKQTDKNSELLYLINKDNELVRINTDDNLYEVNTDIILMVHPNTCISFYKITKTDTSFIRFASISNNIKNRNNTYGFYDYHKTGDTYQVYQEFAATDQKNIHCILYVGPEIQESLIVPSTGSGMLIDVVVDNQLAADTNVPAEVLVPISVEL